jgi:Ran GTPase-activating protein (RanGAP) involved in mRNA processing and transport
MGVRQGLALPRDRRGWFAVEIQFTRIRKDYFVTTIEPDAMRAMLDRHMIGDNGESLSDRLWAANAYSADNDAFWAELAEFGGSEVTDTEVDFDLDEEDSDEDEDDEDDDDDDEEESDDDLIDVDALLIDA